MFRFVICSVLVCQLQAASLDRVKPREPNVAPIDDFSRADVNKDNKVNLDEFLHKDQSYIWLMEDNFAKYDTNRDGFVSKAEYDVIANAEKKQEELIQQESWREVLEDFDKDGDGFLQLAEMSQYLTTSEIEAKDKRKHEQIFKQFDTHKDMKLDMKEFDDYLANVAPFLFGLTNPSWKAAVNHEPTADEQFKTVDFDKDNRLNFEEFLHKDPYHLTLVIEEFRKFDSNSDGIVTRSEYDDKINADSQDSMHKFISEFDINGDKELQEEEVLKFLSERHGVKPKDTFAFHQFDTKINGALDTREFGQFDANLPWEDMEDIAVTDRPIPSI